jgi:hypothetical protein
VEQLELVVVQFVECRRLIEKRGIAYLRLALILVDNVAEVIMSERISNELRYNQFHQHVLDAENLEKLWHWDIETVAKSREKYVPESKRRDIERNFGKKVEFLVGRGMIPAEIGAGLQKLHSYRNEAQHRGKLRSHTLAAAVRIYYDMACTLLGDYDKPGPMLLEVVAPTEFVQRYPVLSSYAPPPESPLGNLVGIPKIVSERLLAECRSMLRHCGMPPSSRRRPTRLPYEYLPYQALTTSVTTDGLGCSVGL